MRKTYLIERLDVCQNRFDSQILVCWPVFKRGQVACAWTTSTHQSVEVSLAPHPLEVGLHGHAM